MKLVMSEQLPRQNLVNLLVNRLKDWVASGHLKPGERLPSETELAQLFHISKPVVREAIARLNALQIIETYHGKGSFVSESSNSMPISIDEMAESDTLAKDLWELRSVFEPMVVGLAAINCQPEDIVRLEDVLQNLQAALDRGENGVLEDDIFHLYVAHATHNPLIIQFAAQVARLAEPYKRLSLKQPFRSEETLKELKSILAAMRVMDKAAAYKAMENHIQMS